MGRGKRAKKGPELMTLVVAALAVVILAAAAAVYLGRTGRSPSVPAASEGDGAGSETESPASRWATDEELIFVRRAVGSTGIVALGIDRFRVRLGRYPRNLDELLRKPDGLAAGQHWDGPYVNNPRLLTDPWSQQYRYKSSGEHNTATYDLWSIGADGIDGSSDDIGNW